MSEHVILTPIYGFYGHFHTGKMMIKLWILGPLFSIKLKCGLPKYLGKIEITTTAEGHIVSGMDNLPLYMGIHHQQNIGMCSLGGMISKHAWNIISFYNMIHVFFLFRFYVNFPWSIWTPQMEDVRRKKQQHFFKGSPHESWSWLFDPTYCLSNSPNMSLDFAGSNHIIRKTCRRNMYQGT